MTRPALAVALALPIALTASGGAAAQESAFRPDPARVPVGTIYIYEKSNIDGTNMGRIAHYVARSDRLESFKWHPGEDEATLVTADIAWERAGSVRRFESWKLFRGGRTRLQGWLELVPGTDTYRVQLDTLREVTLTHWPWHSYDFDFASLGFAMRFLVAPTAPFTVQVADILRTAQGPRFGQVGAVTARFETEEQRNGVRARRYSVDGPGLDDRGGHLWIAVEGDHLLDYEIAQPDEPGFESGKLRLVGIERADSAGWVAWRTDRLEGRR